VDPIGSRRLGTILLLAGAVTLPLVAGSVGRGTSSGVTLASDTAPAGLVGDMASAETGPRAVGPLSVGTAVTTTILADGFEGAFPGPWRVTVSGTRAWWGSTPHRAAVGARSAYCAGGGEPAAPAGGPYFPNMATWLTYGPFSLADATAAKASFRFWLQSQSEHDFFKWLISVDGVHFHGWQTSGPHNAWEIVSFDFASAAAITAVGAPRVWFAIVFLSDGSVQGEGAYVDDVHIEKTSPESQAHFVSWVPVVSHTAGAQGSQWRTDLALLNEGAVGAAVDLRLHADSGTATRTTTVAAGAQAILTDVVGQFGVSGSAALEIRCSQRLQVSSRTYNKATTGTFGQEYDGVDPGGGLIAGQDAYLPHLIENAAYRTNIALVNTGTTTATATVTLFNGAGGQLGSYSVTLQPGQWRQEYRPFNSKAGQSNLSRGWARVSVEAGEGVFAFASLIDNLTSDPTTIPTQRAASGSLHYHVPVASHAGGANNSKWRTDVGILNAGTATATVRLMFTATGAVRTSTTTVGAGVQSILTDVVAQLGAEGTGAIEVVADHSVFVTSRTYNQSSSGTFGQGLACPDGDEVVLQRVVLPQLSEDAVYRSNIALTNTSAADAGAKVTLFDGTGRSLASYQVILRPGEWKQENRPFRTKAGQTNVTSGWARVEVTQGQGVIAAASVVDNATNDPTTIAGRASPLAQGVIGSAGGTLSTPGITVTVPAGAFPAAAAVAIDRISKMACVEGFRVGSVFTLSGMPATTSAPIQVRLAGMGGARRYAVVDNEAFAPSAAAMVHAPLLLAGTTVASDLVVQLPAWASPGASAASELRPMTAAAQAAPGTTAVTVTTVEADLLSGATHFHVFYRSPTVSGAQAATIGSDLETAYTRIAGLGFDWARRKNWPVKVCIEPFTGSRVERLAEIVPSRWGTDHYTIVVNETLLANPAMPAATAHELLHLVQALYDPRGDVAKAVSPGPWYWMDEATAIWFENAYINSYTTVPSEVVGNAFYFVLHFLEFPPGEAFAVQCHGYGAGSLIRFLQKERSDTQVAQMMRRCATAGVNPVDALVAQVGAGGMSAFWGKYLNEFTSGTLYDTPFPESREIISQAGRNRYKFEGPTNTGTTIPLDYSDLTADFYNVWLNDTSWPSGTTVKVSAPSGPGETTVHVFENLYPKLTRLGGFTGSGAFDVTNAEALVAAGKHLIIAVANGRAVAPYTGRTAIPLRIERVDPPAGQSFELKFEWDTPLLYSCQNVHWRALVKGAVEGPPGMVVSTFPGNPYMFIPAELRIHINLKSDAPVTIRGTIDADPSPTAISCACTTRGTTTHSFVDKRYRHNGPTVVPDSTYRYDRAVGGAPSFYSQVVWSKIRADADCNGYSSTRSDEVIVVNVVFRIFHQ
jgi:hypothetical protein